MAAWVPRITHPQHFLGTMRVLVIYSNPPGLARLRLDKEDRAITGIARQYSGKVAIERQHASEVDDIHALLSKGEYDIIQFSGHGSEAGIYLDKSDFNDQDGELVGPNRLLSLLELSRKTPLCVILLCCYSDSSLQLLADAAPFVITCKCEVSDSACVGFISSFYDRLFSGESVQHSYEHALNILRIKNHPTEGFNLSRRCLIRRAGGLFVESKPDSNRDSILVSLDAVSSRLGSFGMSEEELCHMLARKLRVHSWIFDGASDRAVIPIGRLLFGEFTWQNAKDVVYCSRLMKLRSDIPRRHWELWSRILTSY